MSDLKCENHGKYCTNYAFQGFTLCRACLQAVGARQMLRYSDNSKQARNAAAAIVPDPGLEDPAARLQLPVCRIEPHLEELAVRLLHRIGSKGDVEFLRAMFPGYVRIYDDPFYGEQSHVVSHQLMAVILVRFLNKLHKSGVNQWGPGTVLTLVQQLANTGMLAPSHSRHGASTLLGRVLSDPGVGIRGYKKATTNKRFLWVILTDKPYAVPRIGATPQVSEDPQKPADPEQSGPEAAPGVKPATEPQPDSQTTPAK